MPEQFIQKELYLLLLYVVAGVEWSAVTSARQGTWAWQCLSASGRWCVTQLSSRLMHSRLHASILRQSGRTIFQGTDRIVMDGIKGNCILYSLQDTHLFLDFALFSNICIQSNHSYIHLFYPMTLMKIRMSERPVSLDTDINRGNCHTIQLSHTHKCTYKLLFIC